MEHSIDKGAYLDRQIATLALLIFALWLFRTNLPRVVAQGYESANKVVSLFREERVG